MLGCEQDFRSPSSLITMQYYWWIAMSALLLRAVMCVPMYLFEHHLACDLVLILFVRTEGIVINSYKCIQMYTSDSYHGLCMP